MRIARFARFAHCSSSLLRVRGQEYGALTPKLRCVMTQRQTRLLLVEAVSTPARGVRTI